MKRVRTIRGIIKFLHEADPNCAVSEFCLRKLIKSGELPARRSGNVYLINIEDVEEFFDMKSP